MRVKLMYVCYAQGSRPHSICMLRRSGEYGIRTYIDRYKYIYTDIIVVICDTNHPKRFS